MASESNKKTVRTFAAASFLNDFGSDMIFPVWPLFVTSLGASMAVLGLIDGIGNAFVSLSQALSGYLSDRWRKRKIFVWAGYLISSLSRIGYALSPTWHYLIPFRVLDRSGKMRTPPRDAIIADASTGADLGRNFGLLRAMDNLGAVCGIVVAILLIDRLGFRNLFLLAAVPSIIAAVLIAARVRERADSGLAFRGMRLTVLNRNFLIFLTLSALFALGSFSYSFLLVFADRFGFKSSFVPVLYLIFTVFAFLSSVPFGRLSDRFGRKPVIALSFILWGLVCLGFISYQTGPGMIAGFVLYGLHRGALDTVQSTFVCELIPPSLRASGMGGFQMAVGVCALPASLIAGLLWDGFGPTAPFYFSLCMTVLAGLLLPLVKKTSLNEEERCHGNNQDCSG